MVRRSRWLFTLGVLFMAATLGSLTAWIWSETDRLSPSSIAEPGDAEAVIVYGPDGSALGREQDGDPALEFPPRLSGPPNSPSHLAVHNSTGEVWFVVFTYDGKWNQLYRYNPLQDVVETFPLPASTGSELFSAIAVNEHGHVIVAEGEHVLDFDPASQTYRELPLPPPVSFQGVPSGQEGTFVTDMTLDGEGSAYLGRMNSGAVTKLHLSTGEITDIPVPASFGIVYFVAYTSDGLWISNWAGSGGVAPQVGRIDPSSKQFQPANGGASGLEAVLGGEAYIARAGTSEASRITDSGDQVAAQVPGSISGLRDFLAVDLSGNVFWVTGEGATAIARIDDDEKVRQYELPLYVTIVHKVCPAPLPGGPTPDDCDAQEVIKTRVRGLAVAPNGDLYFSDATRNRIGVIRAGR